MDMEEGQVGVWEPRSLEGATEICRFVQDIAENDRK